MEHSKRVLQKSTLDTGRMLFECLMYFVFVVSHNNDIAQRPRAQTQQPSRQRPLTIPAFNVDLSLVTLAKTSDRHKEIEQLA